MEKSVFLNYVKTMIIPLFTGSSIAGEEISTSRDSEVALGKGGTILIKPSRNEEYRLVLKRGISFKSADVVLIKSIIQEINSVSQISELLIDKGYIERLNLTAIEKAICESVSEVASDALLGIVTMLDSYSTRTYEGKPISFGVILNEIQEVENRIPNRFFKNMFNYDFFTVLSNGMQSCVEFDKDGYYLGHISLERMRFKPTLCSYDYMIFARFCDSNRIGIALDISGNILIFKNRSLVYTKKRGVWNSYCHDEIISLLSYRRSESIKEIRKSIYMTALDVSFAGTGGCIAYLNKDSIEQVLSHIDISDILSERHFDIKKTTINEPSKRKKNSNFIDYPNLTYDEYIEKYENTKTNVLRTTIGGRKFQELSRKLREELASIDGAIIVDYDGTIIACGAIVRIEAGSVGGGRLAAASTLGKYGVAMKISQDGSMQAFMTDKKTNKSKEIFTVG